MQLLRKPRPLWLRHSSGCLFPALLHATRQSLSPRFIAGGLGCQRVIPCRYIHRHHQVFCDRGWSDCSWSLCHVANVAGISTGSLQHLWRHMVYFRLFRSIPQRAYRTWSGWCAWIVDRIRPRLDQHISVGNFGSLTACLGHRMLPCVVLVRPQHKTWFKLGLHDLCVSLRSGRCSRESKNVLSSRPRFIPCL